MRKSMMTRFALACLFLTLIGTGLPAAAQTDFAIERQPPELPPATPGGGHTTVEVARSRPARLRGHGHLPRGARDAEAADVLGDLVVQDPGPDAGLIAGLFLIFAGYSQDQMAPMMGLLGTVAGYLLGKENLSGLPAPPRDGPPPAS